ncbi:Uncharacterised protein [Chromobacterium violaceum]|uniref:Ferrous iron transporter FeoA-like domain-containing protein n=1 Tax=Chromobacterium violaceum TaxID=536 RepID=A0A447TIU6_CHRVL|nr:Uncharacterised protein [Chromobacterium violaceum]
MQSLDGFPAGACGVVDRLDLNDEAFRRVAAFGLVPGCRFHLRRAAPWGGRCCWKWAPPASCCAAAWPGASW